MARTPDTPVNGILRLYSILVTWPAYVAGRIWRNATRSLHPAASIDIHAVRSIALVRLDEMGDFVIFSSILKPLREALPGVHIALVLREWLCPLAQHCPYVDEIIPFPGGGPKWSQFLFGPFRAAALAIAKLSGRFDLVINARYDRDIRGAGFLAHFTRAPQVLGYPTSAEPAKSRINRGQDRFYTHFLPVAQGARHEIERSREILRYLGLPAADSQPELWLDGEDRKQARALMMDNGWRPGEPLVCLGVHAGYPRRMWPIESYGELAGMLNATSQYKYLLVGALNDREYGELLRPALGASLINLSGLGGLRARAAAIEECCLYIGSDSGPKHLAAALGKPVLEISCHPIDGDPAHFQSPARFGPLGVPWTHHAPTVALPPCHGSCESHEPHCIRQVTVAEVYQAALAAISQHSPVWSGD